MLRKKLLLVILLIVVLILTGCTRKYECDVGTINADGEFQSLHGGEKAMGSSTPDWWDFRYTTEDAKENCEAAYNPDATVELTTDVGFISFENVYLHCICERVN